MACVHDGRFVSIMVQNHHNHRHEPVDPQHRDAIVQFRHCRCRMVFAGQAVLGFRGDFGHHHRGRHAVSHDIRDQDGRSAIGEGDVVVVIAAHVIGRRVERGEAIAAQRRWSVWQEGSLHFAGQGQVTFQIDLAECLLVQLRIVNRNSRLHAYAGKDLQVFPTELLPLVQRIQLDHPQSLPLGVEQGGAHHRPDPQVGDALADIRPFRHRVLGQNRLFGLHHSPHNRPADANRFFAALASLSPRRGQFLVVRLQHDETAVGLKKDLEKTVQNLGQYLVQSQRAAQIARDLDQGGQTRLGADGQLPDPRRTAADIDLRDDRRSRHVGQLVHHDHPRGLAGVLDRVGGRGGRRTASRGGGVIIENEHNIAQTEQIALAQGLRLATERSIVQESTVAAAHVSDIQTTLASRNRCMPSAHLAAFVQKDGTCVVPADRHFVAIQLVTSPRLRTYFDLQISHATIPKFRVTKPQSMLSPSDHKTHYDCKSLAGRPSTTDAIQASYCDSMDVPFRVFSAPFGTAGLLSCAAWIDQRLNDGFKFCVFVFPETYLGLKRADFVGQC